MKMKKIISTILIFALVLTGLGYTPAVQAATDTESEETDVTPKTEVPEGYTGIYDISDLAGIKSNLEGNYILMNDIDMSETAEGGDMDAGNGWSPIQNFAGVLDGNGYRIKNMHIFGEMDTQYVGLFGYLSGATIENLGLVDVDIDVTYTEGLYCGGVAGYVAGGFISKSFVTGKIVALTNNSDVCCGGIVGKGYMYWVGSYSNITNCYNVAEIQTVGVNGTYSGGIIGKQEEYKVEKCYNLGNVNDGEGAAIAGQCSRSEYILDCFFLKGTGTEDYGSPLSDAQMKKSQWFTNFDFENVWEMDANYIKHQYPQLKSCMQNKIEEISIETPPTETEYQQGDKLDLTGGILKIVYEDGYDTTAFLTEDILGEYDMTKLGTQEIEVRKGNASTSFQINVTGIKATGVIFDKTDISIYKGYSETITATVVPENATDKEITWSSADETIAIVDQNGVVTAKGAGTTEIIAETKNGIQATCTVSVKIPVVMIQVSNPNIVLMQGQMTNLFCSVAPIDSTDTIVWTSSDESVVSVNSFNQITGVSGGTAIVTATADSGVSASCTVTVHQNISEFGVTGIRDMVYTGNEITQNVVVSNGIKTLREGVDYTVTYEDNTHVGTATITITGISPYIGVLTRTFEIKEAPEQSSNETTSTKTTTNPTTKSTAPAKVKKLKLKKKKAKKITTKSRYNLSWAKVKGADGYEVQGYVSSVYRRALATKNVKLKTVKKTSLKNQKIFWYKILPTAPEANYVSKVRVRAYKIVNGKKVYGKYSAWKTILSKKQVKKETRKHM